MDAFSYHVSRSGMNDRLYSPRYGHGVHASGRGGHPLVVWLHGGGEGGSLPDGAPRQLVEQVGASLRAT